MAWLSRVFKTKTDRIEPSDTGPSKAFDAMSLEDILRATSLPSNFTFHELSGLYVRLLTIGYAEESTYDQRVAARRVGDAVVADLEASFSGTPGGLRPLRDWLTTVRSEALTTKIQSVSPEKLIDVLVAEENSHLMSDFIASVETDRWTAFRPEVVRQLVMSRTCRKGDNPVFLLYWLLHTRDRTAWHVLTGEERRTLLRADTGYTEARELLVRLGLLPHRSGALPYLPLPDRATLKVFLAGSLQAENAGVGVTPEIIEREEEHYGEEFVYGVKLLRIAFRQALALRLSQGIYGQAFADELRGELKTMFVTKPAQVATLFAAAEEAFSISEHDDSPLSVAQILLAVLPEWMGDRDESVKEAAFQLATNWLEPELYEFPRYWRFLVRLSIHGENKTAECMVEDNEFVDF